MALSLSGLRVAPFDRKTKEPKTNVPVQFVEDGGEVIIPKFTQKERSGFSGGFKIPEEQRIAKLGRKIRHTVGDAEDEHEEVGRTDITKEEILAQLDLGSAQAAGGMGKHGTGSK